jgi:hypothetical protein
MVANILTQWVAINGSCEVETAVGFCKSLTMKGETLIKDDLLTVKTFFGNTNSPDDRQRQKDTDG